MSNQAETRGNIKPLIDIHFKKELLVDTVTDGDNTHAVTPNAVHDYINTIIGSIEEDMLS